MSLLKRRSAIWCVAVLMGVAMANENCGGKSGLDQTPPTANGEPRFYIEERNRLGEQTSPYLLQHAQNPVHWYPWGEEAFEAARTQHKPIFLSIGYSTCLLVPCDGTREF